MTSASSCEGTKGGQADGPRVDLDSSIFEIHRSRRPAAGRSAHPGSVKAPGHVEMQRPPSLRQPVIPCSACHDMIRSDFFMTFPPDQPMAVWAGRFPRDPPAPPTAFLRPVLGDHGRRPTPRPSVSPPLRRGTAPRASLWVRRHERVDEWPGCAIPCIEMGRTEAL